MLHTRSAAYSTVQPTLGARINWANPITKGLLRAWGEYTAGNFIRDAVTGRRSAFGSGSGVWGEYWSPGPSGMELRIDNTGAGVGGPSLAVGGDWTFSRYFTVSVEITLAATSAYDQNLFVSGATWNRPDLRFKADRSLQIVEPGVANHLYTAAGVVNVGRPTRITYVSAPSGLLIYVDNVLAASNTTTPAWNMSTAGYDWYLYPSFYNNGSKASNFLLWNRALTANEVASIAANSWQVYVPTQKTLWVPATAGGSSSYTFIPSGNITFSGAATLAHGKVFTPSGSLVFSGTVVLARGKVLQPSGSIAFSGSAPFSQTSSYLFSPTGELTLQGGVPYLIRGKIILPTGNLNLSGTAPLIFLPAGGALVNNLTRLNVKTSKDMGL